MPIYCPMFMCLYLLSNSSHPNLFPSSGKKNFPTSFPRILIHSSHVGWSFTSDIVSVGRNVFSGSLTFSIVHVPAFGSKLGYGLSVKFKGLKNLPIPTPLSLLLDMLCIWHLNYGV